jgi:hypothetical protein
MRVGVLTSTTQQELFATAVCSGLVQGFAPLKRTETCQLALLLAMFEPLSCPAAAVTGEGRARRPQPWQGQIH